MAGDMPDESDSSMAKNRSVCCLHEAALTACTAPVLVYDEDKVLYSNPVVDSVLAGPGAGSIIGRSRAEIVAPDIAEAARDRVRLMTENGAVFDDLLIKARRLDGTFVYAKAWCAGIQYRDGRAVALVMSFAAGIEYVDPYVLLGHKPERAHYPLPECVHVAAFDALPVPMVIYDAHRMLAVNARACQFLGSDGPLDGTSTLGFRHRDVAEAADARLEYVFTHRNPVYGYPGKYSRLDGSIVRAVGDTIPFDFDGTAYAVYSAKKVQL